MPDEPVVTAVEPTPPIVEPVVPVEVIPAAPVTPEVPATPVVPTKDFYATASEVLTAGGFVPSEVADKIKANGGEISQELYSELATKLGKPHADFLSQGYEVKRAGILAQQEIENKKVFDVVGGKDTWEAIAKWTSTEESGLSAEAATAYNEMLAAGGVKAAIAANALKEAYMASPGFTSAPALVTGDGSPAPTGVTPISRSEYVAEKQKAINANDAVAVSSLEARARFTQANHANLWRSVKLSF